MSTTTKKVNRVLVIGNIANYGGITTTVANAIHDNAEYIFVFNTTYPTLKASYFAQRYTYNTTARVLIYDIKDYEFDYSYIDNSKFSELCGNGITKPILNISSFKDLVDHIEPDIIHVFIPGSQKCLYLNQIPNFQGLKFCTVCCDQHIGFNTDLFDKIHFISEYNYSINRSLVPANKVKIHHPVNYSHCYNVNNLWQTVDDDQPISIGRISAYCPSKQIEHTIECARIFPECSWTVAGEIQDQKYYDYLREKVLKEKINIKLLTNVSSSHNILRSLNIYHYPTSHEAFCFSIYEAMTKGLPIISYNNGAVPEFTKTGVKEHGFKLADNFYSLVPMTEELINLAKKSKTKLCDFGNKNINIIHQHYNKKPFSEFIKELYNG